MKDIVATTKYRVPYAETDQMQVVYHANYIVYFERLRNELIRLSGISYRDIEDEGLMFPVMEVSAEYHKGARYDDEIEIKGWFDWIQGSRFQCSYEIFLEDELLVSGKTVHTTITKDGRPRRVPENLVNFFAREAVGV